MNEITSKSSLSRFSLLYFLLFCSLFMSESAFSRNHWREDFVKPRYDTPSSAFLITFKVIDYEFGPGNETGYLEVGDFEYSSDGLNFEHLFRCDVRDQDISEHTSMIMRFKKFGEKLQFLNCVLPQDGSFWADSDTEPRVEVQTAYYNDHSGLYFRNAYMTMKWTPGKDNQNVNYIRIKGYWKVNGAYDGDNFDQIYKVKKYKMEPDPDQL